MDRCLAIFIVLFFSVHANADAPLLVGFAHVDITPDPANKPIYLAGFGQNRLATEIHDRLFVRAMVLKHDHRQVAIASVDVVGLFLPFVERIRQQLPGFDYVIVASTHNHHGPDTLGLWGASPVTSGVNRSYMTMLESRIVTAIKHAADSLTPVTPSIGIAADASLLHDSRKPIVKHDELVAIVFRNGESKPAGILVQWNCHPETIHSKNTKLSSDFVGTTCARLEKQYQCPVIYITGTVGGLMTSMHVPVRDAAGKLLTEGSFEKTMRYGELVAELSQTAITQSKPVRLTPIGVDRQSLLLPVDNPRYRLARQLGVLDREIEAWNGDPYAGLGPLLNKVERRPGIRTEIGRLRLGELEIAIIPGEIYPELVLGKVQDPADANADFADAPIEPAIYQQLKSPYRMIVGLGNDELGYIIPKRQWDEKPPFCFDWKKAPYGEINSLGPDTAPILCNAFRRLCQIGKD